MRIAAFLVLVLMATVVKAQTRVYAKIDTVAKAVYADNLDYIYLLSDREELLKYDQKGVIRWRYSNNRFGKLHSVDVSDPLRVVLFYADFQQVVVLNNNLNEIISYSFAKNGNWLVSAVASANNNSLWVFERNANVLLKLGSTFNEDSRSANFFQLFDEVIVPKKISASDQFVFVQHNNGQILQFDSFGAFVSVLPIDTVAEYSIASNLVVYLSGTQLARFNPNSLSTSLLQLPVSVPIKQLAVGNKIIAVLTEKAVFLLSDN